jgi:hypothetical protein
VLTSQDATALPTLIRTALTAAPEQVAA